jgi:signal transduction histidine kinase
MLDITLQEVNKNEIEKELIAKTDQNQVNVTIAGAIAQALWFICDYLLIKEHLTLIFISRLVVLILPLILIAFRKKIGINGSQCFLLLATLLSVTISFIINSFDENILLIYVFGYSILFVGAGALANWKLKYSLIFVVFSLVTNLIFYNTTSTIPLDVYIVKCIVPLYSSALISILMINNRRKILIHELRITKALEHSNQKLEEQKNKINAELDFLIYSISHDLRSPLMSVKGLLALIAESEETNANVKTYLKMADGSIDRLDQTIYDILEYSKNSRTEIQNEDFNIRELVEQINADLKHYNEKAVDFQISIQGSNEIHTDKKRLVTVIKNLISNAVKYSKTNAEPSFVKFEMNQVNEFIEIQVSDNGIGIHKDQHTRIFEMFYRVSTGRVGSGLGLFIVKEIMEKMGGNISLQSELNIGSTFTVRLPKINANQQALLNKNNQILSLTEAFN